MSYDALNVLVLSTRVTRTFIIGRQLLQSVSLHHVRTMQVIIISNQAFVFNLHFIREKLGGLVLQVVAFPMT